MIEALRLEEVKGILIDTYVAAEHKDHLAGFKKQMVIEHISSYGIVFLNEGLRFDKCIRDYVFSRQNEISDIIRNRVKLLEVKKQIRSTLHTLLSGVDQRINPFDTLYFFLTFSKKFSTNFVLNLYL